MSYYMEFPLVSLCCDGDAFVRFEPNHTAAGVWDPEGPRISLDDAESLRDMATHLNWLADCAAQRKSPEETDKL